MGVLDTRIFRAKPLRRRETKPGGTNMPRTLLAGCRVGIVGASIAGLSAARELRKLGAEVTVAERSAHPLAGRGAGISMDPVAHAWLQAEGVVDDYLPIRRRVALGRDDRELWTQPLSSYATTWDALHEALARAVPAACLRPGEAMVGLEAGRGGVEIELSTGRHLACDLLLCADGIGSRGRELLFPDLALPYAGYVIVRGVLDEAALDATAARALRPLYDEGTMLYYLAPQAHAVAYLVPGTGDAPTEPGRRQVNWGWYVNVAADELGDFLTDRDGVRHPRSIPPGLMAEDRRTALLELARSLFPASFHELVAATARPFEQAIFSYMVPRMVQGRVALLGDAAHLARPHVGSGALMALQDARCLRESLEATGGDIDTALAAFDGQRLPACGATVAVGDRLGIAHQGRLHDWERFTPADFEAWWAAVVKGGEPLYFERRT
jgi:2-polyprenyl-6-methoxyphenol hydroxylase-like FAD-dependent oxidoreductase